MQVVWIWNIFGDDSYSVARSFERMVFKWQAVKSCESRGLFCLHGFRLPCIQHGPVLDHFSCIKNTIQHTHPLLRWGQPRRWCNQLLVLNNLASGGADRRHNRYSTDVDATNIWYSRNWRRNRYSCEQQIWDMIKHHGILNKSKTQSVERYSILNRNAHVTLSLSVAILACIRSSGHSETLFVPVL